ncbi:MAG: hypothetical protein GY869_10115 [Planctomycetes bacterium]|nr:hypothetical protein [Planctomycetota bacterium]
MSSFVANMFTLRFSYLHFHTDGKLVNMVDALKTINSTHACLSLTDKMVDLPEISDQLKRTRSVIHKLRRQGITSDLVIPAYTDLDLSDAKVKLALKAIISHSSRLAVQTIWLDDSRKNHHKKVNRRNLLSWFGAVGRIVGQIQPRVRLGLIAAEPDYYLGYNLTSGDLAEALAGRNIPLLAQSQSFGQDYDRCGILQAGYALSLTAAQNAGRSQIQLVSMIDQPEGSHFHKSTEATQMQINLSLLYGFQSIILDCFDKVGTAAGSENPYLNMVNHSRKFLGKLIDLLPRRTQTSGICVVAPDKCETANRGNPAGEDQGRFWTKLLWRMGMPVRMVTPEQVSEFEDGFVLTGSTPKMLKRVQLQHVFHQGVLLDSEAAAALKSMKLSKMTGIKVGGCLRDAHTEIITDQSFAASFYGHNFLLADHFSPRQFRRLHVDHPNARPITTLIRKDRIPNTEGLVIFDDIDNRRRCATLPYTLSGAGLETLLNTSRQRHFQDLFRWLLRRRMDCYMENAADLVCYYIPIPRQNRMLICLLNTGFDWAIDSRVRLGRLPVMLKRLGELDEHGRLNHSAELKLQSHHDYQYIQLNSDIAVPPMQMTVLLAE